MISSSAPGEPRDVIRLTADSNLRDWSSAAGISSLQEWPRKTEVMRTKARGGRHTEQGKKEQTERHSAGEMEQRSLEEGGDNKGNREGKNQKGQEGE